MSDLKIQSGRFYRTRDGRKVGPMVLDEVDGLHWKQDGTGGPLWSPSGLRWFHDPDRDIIAEWAEEPEAAHFASREEMVWAIPVPAPDYNDGNWHGWHGGECPDSIHPASVVEFVWHSFNANKAGLSRNDARAIMWAQVIRFRVVKPYTAPREWWIVGDCEAYASEAEALEACKALYDNPAPVHVREVKE